MTELAPDLRVVELERQVEQLQTALVTNRVTATAIGLLMAQYQVNREQAFARLVSQSQRMNIRLDTVALELVTRAEVKARQRKTGTGQEGHEG